MRVYIHKQTGNYIVSPKPALARQLRKDPNWTWTPPFGYSSRYKYGIGGVGWFAIHFKDGWKISLQYIESKIWHRAAMIAEGLSKEGYVFESYNEFKRLHDICKRHRNSVDSKIIEIFKNGNNQEKEKENN